MTIGLVSECENMKSLRRFISKLLKYGRFFHAIEGAVCGILLIIGILLLSSGYAIGFAPLALALGGAFMFISYEYIELRLRIEKAGETLANICEFLMGMIGILFAFLIGLIVVISL